MRKFFSSPAKSSSKSEFRENRRDGSRVLHVVLKERLRLISIRIVLILTKSVIINLFISRLSVYELRGSRRWEVTLFLRL